MKYIFTLLVSLFTFSQQTFANDKIASAIVSLLQNVKPLQLCDIYLSTRAEWLASQMRDLPQAKVFPFNPSFIRFAQENSICSVIVFPSKLSKITDKIMPKMPRCTGIAYGNQIIDGNFQRNVYFLTEKGVNDNIW